MKDFIKDGKCLYSIVMPENASKECKFAVEELVYAIGECCGDKPNVLTDGENLPENCIHVGDTRRALEAGVKPSFEEADADGYFVGVVDGDAFISAFGQEGLIYGAYEFLLDNLGAEYFAPDEYYLPKTENAKLCETNVSAKPDVATRVRSLSYSKLDEKAERRFGYNVSNGRYWVYWAHSHFQIVPKEKYWNTHREYYTEDGAQLCLTAPGLVDTVIENILATLTPETCSRSDVLYIMVGHEDNGTFCNCPRCRAEAEKHGGKSGVMMRFVNPIADAVTAFMKENYPNKKVSVITFGYGPTIDPPVVWKEDNTCVPVDESVIAHENVGIMLAPLGADWAHSLTDFDYNAQTAKSLIGWKALKPELFVWTYDSVFDDSFIFIDNWKYLGESYRVFGEYGAVYIFDEGHEGLCFNFWHMRNYVRAKLMWDLDSDVDSLISHFAKHYYKEGEPYVMKYFRSLREHSERLEKEYAEEGKIYRQLSYIRTWPDYRSERTWSKEYLEECLQIFEEGREKVKNDEVRNRLEIEMLGVIYLYMELYAYKLSPEVIRRYHDLFKEITLRNGSYYCAEHGMTHALTNEKKMMTWRSYLMKDEEVTYEQE